MKKLLKSITAIALCMSMTVPAFASEVENNAATTDFQTKTFNELEYYLELKDLSAKELTAIGYSAEEISDINQFSIEEVYLERAQLPYETLVA